MTKLILKIKAALAAGQQRKVTSSFFEAKGIGQLIAEQRVQPIADLSVLGGAIPDEDVDEFVADIYRGRES